MHLDLNPYGRNNPDGKFPHFYKQVAWNLAPKSAVIFRHLVMRVIFRHAGDSDVVPETKESFSSDIGNFRPILNTPLLPKIFDKSWLGS